MSWLRRTVSSALDIVLNSGSMVATTAVTSGLGAVYWWLATHEFPPSAVGLAGALVSAMTLLGVVSTVGFSTALIPELADDRTAGRAGLVLGALLSVAAVGACLGALWQAVVPLLRPDLALPGAGPGTVALFAAGVSLTALTLVLDQALIGLLRGMLQLFRNGTFALVKLAALLGAGLLLGGGDARTIYATWAVGQAASLAVLAAVLLRGRRPLRRSEVPRGRRAGWGVPRPRIPHALRATALVHHVFNLSLAAPAWVLPLIATALVSATADAYFYSAWTLAAFVFVGPLALTTVLYAAASQPARGLGHPLRLSLVLSLLWAVGAAGGCAIFGSQLLGLFGRSYAVNGAPVLLVLALSAIPQVAKLHYVALTRLRGRFGAGILMVGAGGLLELALAGFGATRGGIGGLALGYLLANCVEALVMLPAVVGSLARTRARPLEAGGGLPSSWLAER